MHFLPRLDPHQESGLQYWELRMCYWRFWPSLLCCYWSRPDNICKVLILVTPQWLWTGSRDISGWRRSNGERRPASHQWHRGDQSRGQSEQAPATFSQSEAGRVEIKTSCFSANKWSVVNSVLAEASPSWCHPGRGLCDHMTRDILIHCPGTIVPPQWSVIFAIKWRYEGSSWRAANLFPIIIVTNVTESTSNIFFIF